MALVVVLVVVLPPPTCALAVRIASARTHFRHLDVLPVAVVRVRAPTGTATVGRGVGTARRVAVEAERRVLVRVRVRLQRFASLLALLRLPIRTALLLRARLLRLPVRLLVAQRIDTRTTHYTQRLQLRTHKFTRTLVITSTHKRVEYELVNTRTRDNERHVRVLVYMSLVRVIHVLVL